MSDMSYLIVTYMSKVIYAYMGVNSFVGTSTGCPKKNETPIFPYISVRINATVLYFIWAVN
jgi:hypothetical protein